ncbi:MAG: phage head morphogenesis protein [Candidatus Magnetoovum sp. WYHC-5]|nr:phage head morphogenesis protein [Candidatus Magnetoovum sp. WYHC-5]
MNGYVKGITLEQFKKELEPMLKNKGWWGKVYDKNTGQVVQLGSPHRLQTIYRTNRQTAYMTGRWKEQMEDVHSRPYWQYIAVMDSKTRPKHAALNNLIFKYDDPFWEQNYPPNGFNCRCRVRALTKEQVRNKGLQVTTSDGFFGNVRPDEGWGYNPGAAYQLDIAAYEKAMKLPDELKYKFINEMARSQVFQEIFPSWIDKVLAQMKGKKESITVGWMDEETLKRMLANKNIIN